MRNYLEEYRGNIKFTNTLLWPINQGIFKSVPPTTILGLVVYLWPIWYNCIWILYYSYLIFAEKADLLIVCEQIWCLMTIVQLMAKLLNGLIQNAKLQQLMKWCEENYTTKYKTQYEGTVNNVFDKTNIYISLCIR